MEAQAPPRPRLLIALLSAQLALTAVCWLGVLTWPHARGIDEVQVANLAGCWRRGLLPYFDLSRWPACFNPYGPVATWLLGHAPAALNVHVAGRLLAMGSFVGLWALAARLLPAGQRLRLAGGAALLALSLRPVFGFVDKSRVDSLAVALAAGGFLLAVYRRSTASGVAAVVLWALALLTKTTFVAAPVAAVLGLWPTQRRRAVALALGWLLLAGLGVGWLQHATGGLYLHNLRRPLAHPSKMLDMATRLVTTGLAALVWLRLAWREATPEQRRALRPWLWYAAGTWAIGSVTGAAQGSGWNYLMESSVALALGGAFLASGLEPARLARHSGWLALHLAFAVPYLALHEHPWHLRAEQTIARQRALAVLPAEVSAGRRVAVLRNAPAADVLVSLGQPTVLDLVDGMSLPEPLERALAADLLRRHQVDVIYRGRDLERWDPAVPSPRPQAFQR